MIKFSNYFQDWLYGKDGYYTTYQEIGKGGDFYTSVSSSALFGGSIALRILKSIDEGYLSENTTILEVGADRGYLLADIIQFIFTYRPNLLKNLKFAIVEKQQKLQEIQKEYFIKSFGFEIELIHYDSFNDCNIDEAFIVANEIFDAFKCEIIANTKMLYIKEHTLIWDKIDKNVQLLADKYKISKGEVCLGYTPFAKELQNIKKFEFVSFDYGDRVARNDISTRIYKANKVLPLFEPNINLSNFYKKSDITYDVNFELLIGEFESVGIKLLDYKTQMSALLNFGFDKILERLEKSVDFKIYKREVTKAKVLIDPSFLGERFKMVRFRYEG